jgi:prepilin-type N-terminal cleavage/methylation domain-containing protein
MDVALVLDIKLFHGALLGNFIMRSKIKISNQNGFTLLEMLVVILIIGILAGIAIIGLKGATRTARVQSCKVEVSSVYTAALAFKNDNPDNHPDVYDPTVKSTLNPLFPNYLQPISSNARYKIQYRWKSVNISYIQILSGSILYTMGSNEITDAATWGIGTLITVSGNSNNDLNIRNIPISEYSSGTPTTFKVATNLADLAVNTSVFTTTKATSNVPTVEVVDLKTNAVLPTTIATSPESACNNLN